MHYVGTLQADGSEFDSSRSRDKPFVFTLGEGQVIKGWDVCVATMKKGELCNLTLGPSMAYGENGSPPKIPGGATLVFEVELLSWISKNDVFQDGGVIKSKIKEGTGWKKPKNGDEVRLSLKVVDKGGKTVEEKADLEYVLGSGVLGSLSKAVDKVLSEMQKGEEVQLECTPEYAYGSNSEDKGDATVTLVLHQVYEMLDVSFAKDKSLMKKQIVEGEGWDKPKDLTKVKLKVEDATDGNKTLTGFAPKLLEFTAGNGEVCDAIECVASEMKLKEKAVLTCTDPLLVSEVQLGLKDVSGEKVLLTLELLEFSKEKDTWNMDEEEKVAYGAARKEAGSNLFRAGRTRMALERYKKVISLFNYIDNMQDEDKAKAKDLKKVCELNSAACYLKFKDFEEVRKICDTVLKDDANNAKALFRRAQANLKLKDFEKALADIKKNIEIEPQSREARALLKECQAAQKEEHKKSQGLFFQDVRGSWQGSHSRAWSDPVFRAT